MTLRTDFTGLADSQQAHKDDHLVLHMQYNAVYSVVAYGTAGDGVTDDLAAIHAARDAAGVNGVVFFPAGSYFVATAITPLAGQLFLGAGKHATKILVSNAATNNAFAVSAVDVTIEALQIDGQRAAAAVNLSATASAGVYVTAARCTVQQCWIHDVRGMGISASSAANDLHVYDSRIDGGHNNSAGTTGGVYKGIYVSGADRPVVKGCTITGWSQAIGFWFGVVDGLVDGNYILDNYGFEDAGHTVPRSAVEDYGETVVPHGNNVWANNIIDGSTSKCFEIAQGVVGSRYINNVLRNPGKISNLGSCWEVTGQSGQITTDILIQSNVCYGQTAHSDDNTVNGQVYRISIIGNHFIDYTHANNNAPVFIGGLNVIGDGLVANNQFSNCKGGIWLNGNADGWSILGNKMQDLNAGTAISITSGSGHTIANNTISTTLGLAITVITARNRILGNRVKMSYIQVSSADNLIAENEVIFNHAGNLGCIHITGAGALRNKILNNIVESTTGRQAIAIITSANYNIAQGNTLINGAMYTGDGGGANNITEPNHAPTVVKPLSTKALGAQTVGTSEATIAHGLGYAPTVVQITMTSAGNIYKSTASDATNIYLTADAAARTAEVFVR